MSNNQNRSSAKARQAGSGERYLAFLLGIEQFAIPLLQVKEVIEMTEPVSLLRISVKAPDGFGRTRPAVGA